MNTLSENKPRERRRRYPREFKARIVSQCQQEGASVSRIALDNDLNANMLWRWIREAKEPLQQSLPTPGFMPIEVPASRSEHGEMADKSGSIRIEIPRPDGSVIIEWPANRADQCVALVRELLS